MLRTCPQCGRNLSKADNYFCHVCGAVVGSGAEHINRTYFLEHKKHRGKDRVLSFSLWGILVGAGVFILLVGSVLLSSRLAEKAVEKGGALVEKVATQSGSSSGLPSAAPSAPLTSGGTPRISDFENYIPFQTDIVAVFYSHNDFLDALRYFKVENNFDVDFLKNSNRPPYVLLLAVPTDENEEVGPTLIIFFAKQVQRGEYLRYLSEGFEETVLEKAVVLTKDKNVAEEVTQVSQGFHKGIALNSYYANVKNKIPAEVRSKIFVFSNVGVGYVNQLDVEGMPESLKALVLNYMKSGSYYGFVEYE